MRWGKIFLIAGYEFFQRIRSVSFYITSLSPFGLSLGMGLVLALLVLEASESLLLPVGLVDHSGILPASPMDGKEVLVYPSLEEARAALRDHKVQAFVEIPPDYLESGRVLIWVPGTSFSLSLIQSRIESFLRTALIRDRLDPRTARRVIEPMDQLRIIHIDSVDDRGTSEPQAGVSMGAIEQIRQTVRFLIQTLVKYVLMLIFVLSISIAPLYGLEDISRDTANRIGELLLSAVTAAEWFAGKVLGVFMVILAHTLIQVAPVLGIFGGLSWGLLGNPMFVSIQEVGMVPVYYILGVLFYVSLIMLVVALNRKIVTFVATSLSFMNFITTIVSVAPSSRVAIFMSFFPLTAPGAMLVRGMFGGVPLRDVVLSLMVLGVSLAAIMAAGPVVASRALIPGMPVFSIPRIRRRR